MTTTEKEGNVSGKLFSPQKYSLNLGDQLDQLTGMVEKYKAVADNPLIFSQIFLGLKTAMDNFNNLLIDLDKRLQMIEEAIEELSVGSEHDSIELSKKDQEVLDYVVTQGKVSAEDLQEQFSYKGKNAASARLHKLYAVGALDKIQSGRTVYYVAPKPNNPQN